MGNTFRYIADHALLSCGGERCHQCERADVPIYSYRGTIVDPALAQNPELAREEPEVSELCAACILGGNVRKDDFGLQELMPTIKALAADLEQTVEQYHRTPTLPFFQQNVWPLCCGELTEYVGDHPTSGTTVEDYQPWQPQNPIMARFQLTDFYPLEKIPVIYTMALFRCLKCPRGYWVFQYSGLLWLGPVSQ